MHGSSTRLKTARNIILKGAVSGSATFDGSKNIDIDTTLENIVILTGSITLTGLTGDTEETGIVQNIAYPEGFNKDNCFVVSVGFSNVNNTTNPMIAYGSLTADPRAINHGGIDKEVCLKDDSITLISIFYWDGQLSEDRTDTYNFKIALMKT